MAFREVRLFISTNDRELDRHYAREICQPFTWYMDSLMRGRFKEYSGEEVKGINLVNLCLYTKSKVSDMEERSGKKVRFNEWMPMLNTLQLGSEIDLEIFRGSKTENIRKSFEIFIQYASKSDLPQMKKLVCHIQSSLGNQSIDKAIEKADDFFEKLFAK